MLIDNKYEIGQTVYLTTDPDQSARLVTAICVRPQGLIVYELCMGGQVSSHYDFEISEERDVLKAALD